MNNRIKLFYGIYNEIAIIVILAIMSSCSSDDYLKVIPSESTALISIDLPGIAEHQKGVDANLFKALFHVSDASECGIDATSKIFLFEAPDGNLGIAAKVKDADDLNEQMEQLAKKGVCQKPKEKRGKHFTVLSRTWLVGFNDHALLVMGPATGSAAQAALMRQMSQYLDAEEGIENSPMFVRLQEISSPMAMVAQAQALPAQLAALYTLGAPTDAYPDDVLIAASIHSDKGCLVVDGETYSMTGSVNSALKEASTSFRPLKGLYMNQIPDNALLSLSMNVEGKKLLQMMKDNQAFRTLITGMSLSVDMDGFIQSVNGDLTMVLPDTGEENVDMFWNAELSKSLEEIDDNGELGKRKMTNTANSLSHDISSKCVGKQLATIINLTAVSGEKKNVVGVVRSLLNPLFGEVKYVVCTTHVSPLQ